MNPRTPENDSQDGFIIIEVLVSALILAIVAGAVLTLITATTRGAAAQRSHSVAYDLAQADQARLRTMRIPELNRLTSALPRTEVIDGTEYVIRSEAEYNTSKLGRASCTEGSDSSDYIELTSTVTAPTMNRPVTIQSSVAPESGSLDTEHGPLITQTVDAAGKPIPRVTVEIPGSGQKATTETLGCANFAEVPVGSYPNVTFRSNELITPERLSVQTKAITVSADAQNPARLETSWDWPVTIKPEFVYLEPGSGREVAAPVDSMLVTSSSNGTPIPFGTPGGARAATQVASKLYPFAPPSEYTAYAGYCTTNNPGTSTANKVGRFSSVVIPGETYAPRIHIPALELTVTTKEGTKTLAVRGAKVTLTDRACKVGGTNVKRTYFTNGLGHLSNEASVNKETKEGIPAPTEAGVPFGNYEICATATISGTTRAAKVSEVKVENFTSAGTVKEMVLEKGVLC